MSDSPPNKRDQILEEASKILSTTRTDLSSVIERYIKHIETRKEFKKGEAQEKITKITENLTDVSNKIREARNLRQQQEQQNNAQKKSQKNSDPQEQSLKDEFDKLEEARKKLEQAFEEQQEQDQKQDQQQQEQQEGQEGNDQQEGGDPQESDDLDGAQESVDDAAGKMKEAQDKLDQQKEQEQSQDQAQEQDGEGQDQEGQKGKKDKKQKNKKPQKGDQGEQGEDSDDDSDQNSDQEGEESDADGEEQESSNSKGKPNKSKKQEKQKQKDKKSKGDQSGKGEKENSEKGQDQGDGSEGQEDDDLDQDGNEGDGSDGDDNEADEDQKKDGQQGKGKDKKEKKEKTVDVNDVGDMPDVDTPGETPEEQAAKEAGQEKSKDGEESGEEEGQTAEDIADDISQAEADADADAGGAGNDGKSDQKSDKGSKSKGGADIPLIEDSWLDYAKNKSLLAPYISGVAAMLERIKKKQVDQKLLRAKQLEMLPKGGDMDRLNLMSHRDLVVKKHTGQNVSERDLQRFHEDRKEDVDTNVDLILLIDGSGSMTCGSPHPMDAALTGAAIIREAAKKVKGFNVYVGIWGDKNVVWIAKPNSTDKQVATGFESARKGLNSGTELTPAVHDTTQMLSEDMTKKGKKSGYSHIIVVSDGDITYTDKDPAVNSLTTLLSESPETTVDFMIVKPTTQTSETQMEKAAKEIVFKRKTQEVTITKGTDYKRFPLEIVKLLFKKIDKTKSFLAISNNKKRNRYRLAYNRMRLKK